MLRLVLTVLIAHVATSSGSASASAIDDARTFLADNGLASCTDAILRKPGWWTTGAGVDSISDLKYLSDDQIDKRPMPQVKRTILKSLAGEAREQRRADRAAQATLGQRLESLLAALETMLRGFMLGFGASFIYECMWLNRDFYSAEGDLDARVRRAAFRAAVLGCATAVTMHGMAIVVPHSLRHKWLK